MTVKIAINNKKGAKLNACAFFIEYEIMTLYASLFSNTHLNTQMQIIATIQFYKHPDK